MVIYTPPKKSKIMDEEKLNLSQFAKTMFLLMEDLNILNVMIIDGDERNDNIEKIHHEYVDFYTDELLRLKRDKKSKMTASEIIKEKLNIESILKRDGQNER